MSNRNIEIEVALKTIDLLKRIIVAETQQKKDNLLKQLEKVNSYAYYLITEKVFDGVELTERLEKAVKLDEYRPKNISITTLATSNDLDNIHGSFNTFDGEISKMVQNEEEPGKIYKQIYFQGGIANILLRTKQFTLDWIRRLKTHKDLVGAALDSTEDNAVEAYTNLFNALTVDFCKEYDCCIETKIVTCWDKSDIKPPRGQNKARAIHEISWKPGTNLAFEPNKTKKGCFYTQSQESKKSQIRININNIMEEYHTDKKEFFSGMISCFAHEMHHALDEQRPQKGILGPQIANVDKYSFYKDYYKNNPSWEIATETSSYTIQDMLFKKLKNTRF